MNQNDWKILGWILCVVAVIGVLAFAHYAWHLSLAACEPGNSWPNCNF